MFFIFSWSSNKVMSFWCQNVYRKKWVISTHFGFIPFPTWLDSFVRKVFFHHIYQWFQIKFQLLTSLESKAGSGTPLCKQCRHVQVRGNWRSQVSQSNRRLSEVTLWSLMVVREKMTNLCLHANYLHSSIKPHKGRFWLTYLLLTSRQSYSLLKYTAAIN